MLGRDVYRRVLYGARVSLIVGFSVALLASVDRLADRPASPASSAGSTRSIMRVMDGLMSIPPILLAIALMALTRASVQNVDHRHHASPRCRASRGWCAASC